MHLHICTHTMQPAHRMNSGNMLHERVTSLCTLQQQLMFLLYQDHPASACPSNGNTRRDTRIDKCTANATCCTSGSSWNLEPIHVDICRRTALKVCQQCETPDMLRSAVGQLADAICTYETRALARMQPGDHANPLDATTSLQCRIHYLTQITDTSRLLCHAALKPLVALWTRCFRYQPFPCQKVFDMVGVSGDGRSLVDMSPTQVTVVCSEYVKRTKMLLHTFASPSVMETTPSTPAPAPTPLPVHQDLHLHANELHQMLLAWQVHPRLPFGGVSIDLAQQCPHMFEQIPPHSARHFGSLKTLLQFVDSVVHAELQHQQLVWKAVREGPHVTEKAHLCHTMEKLITHFRLLTVSNEPSMLPKGEWKFRTEFGKFREPPVRLKTRGLYWRELHAACSAMDIDTVHMHHHLMFRDWNDPTDSLCSVRTTRALACTGAFRVRNRLRLFFDYAMLVLGELDLNYGRLCAFYSFVHTIFSWPVDQRTGGTIRTGFDIAPKLMHAFGKRLFVRVQNELCNGNVNPHQLCGWLNRLVENRALGESKWLVWRSCTARFLYKSDLLKDHLTRCTKPGIVSGTFHLLTEDTYLVEWLELHNRLHTSDSRCLRDLIASWHALCVVPPDSSRLFTVHIAHWPDAPHHPTLRLHPLLDAATAACLQDHALAHPNQVLEPNWWLSRAECHVEWEVGGEDMSSALTGQSDMQRDDRPSSSSPVLVGACVVEGRAQVFATHTHRNCEDCCIICTDELNRPCTDDMTQVQATPDTAHPPAASHNTDALTGTGPVCRGACGHAFHSCCMDQWLKRTPTCPLCRRKWELATTTTATATSAAVGSVTPNPTSRPSPRSDASTSISTCAARTQPRPGRRHHTVCVRGPVALMNIVMWLADKSTTHESGADTNVSDEGVQMEELRQAVFCSAICRHTSASDNTLCFWLRILQDRGLATVTQLRQQAESTAEQTNHVKLVAPTLTELAAGDPSHVVDFLVPIDVCIL